MSKSIRTECKLVVDEWSYKKDLLKALEQEDLQTLSLAYAYAKNMKLYGEDVTKAWVTAVQQNAILEKAYRDGYYEGLRQTATKEGDGE